MAGVTHDGDLEVKGTLTQDGETVANQNLLTQDEFGPTDLASAYPDGLSVMPVTTGGGWPIDGTATTHKWGADRAVQEITKWNGTDQRWRVRNGSGWSTWVTPALEPDTATDTITTTETTTSTSYTDLATVGPSVTVDVPASGKLLVVVSSMVWTDTAGAASNVDFDLSGANTRSAQDSSRLRVISPSVNATNQQSMTTLLTGLTAGSTTVTLKYKVAGGAPTGSFANRTVSAITL